MKSQWKMGNFMHCIWPILFFICEPSWAEITNRLQIYPAQSALCNLQIFGKSYYLWATSTENVSRCELTMELFAPMFSRIGWSWLILVVCLLIHNLGFLSLRTFMKTTCQQSGKTHEQTLLHSDKGLVVISISYMVGVIKFALWNGSEFIGPKLSFN